MRMSGALSRRCVAYCGYLAEAPPRPHRARPASRAVVPARQRVPRTRNQASARPVLVPAIDEDDDPRVGGDIADARERQRVVDALRLVVERRVERRRRRHRTTKQIGTRRGRPSGAIVARTARRADSRNARWSADRRGSDGIAAYHGLMSQTRWLVAALPSWRSSLSLLIATLGRGIRRRRDRESQPVRDRASARPRRLDGGIDCREADRPRRRPTRSHRRRPPTPTPTNPPATAPPRASGPPLLAWAEFLARPQRVPIHGRRSERRPHASR